MLFPRAHADELSIPLATTSTTPAHCGECRRTMNALSDALLTLRGVWKYHSFLRRSQYFPEAAVKQQQNEWLRELLVHCHRNIPWYSEKFREHGLRLTSPTSATRRRRSRRRLRRRFLRQSSPSSRRSLRLLKARLTRAAPRHPRRLSSRYRQKLSKGVRLL